MAEEITHSSTTDCGLLSRDIINNPSTSDTDQLISTGQTTSDAANPFSLSSYSTNGRYDTVSPVDCERYCGDYVCSVCTVWGYIFCFNKMTRYKRTEVLWVWLTFLSLGIGLFCGIALFGVNEYEAAPTDMRIITRKYSTIFCDKLVLWATVGFNAYRFTGNLSINKTDTELFEREYTTFVEHGDYIYYSYYLLQWSTIDVVSCSDNDMELYVIKGQPQFENWKTDQFCKMCYLEKLPVKINGCFLNYNKYTLTVSETDSYYFVFKNRDTSTWLTTKFHLSRYLFDVSKATHTCVDEVKCQVELHFNTDEMVVYHVNSESPSPIVIMTSTCKSRMWLYTLVFASGPVSMGIVLTVIIHFACSDPQQTKRVPHQHSRHGNIVILDENTPSLNNCQNPPTYEEIISTTPLQPPSYTASIS